MNDGAQHITIDNNFWPPESVMTDYRRYQVECRYDDICPNCSDSDGDGDEDDGDDSGCESCLIYITCYAADETAAADLAEIVLLSTQTKFEGCSDSRVSKAMWKGGFCSEGERYTVKEVA